MEKNNRLILSYLVFGTLIIGIVSILPVNNIVGGVQSSWTGPVFFNGFCYYSDGATPVGWETPSNFDIIISIDGDNDGLYWPEDSTGDEISYCLSDKGMNGYTPIDDTLIQQNQAKGYIQTTFNPGDPGGYGISFRIWVNGSKFISIDSQDGWCGRVGAIPQADDTYSDADTIFTFQDLGGYIQQDFQIPPPITGGEVPDVDKLPYITDVEVLPTNPTNRDEIEIECDVSSTYPIIYKTLSYLPEGGTWKTVEMAFEEPSFFHKHLEPPNKNFNYIINITDSVGIIVSHYGNVIVRQVNIVATLEGLDGENLITGSIMRVYGEVTVDGAVNNTGLFIAADLNGEEIKRDMVFDNGSYLLEVTIPALESGNNSLDIRLIDLITGDEQTLGSTIITGSQSNGGNDNGQDAETFPWPFVFAGMIIIIAAIAGILWFRKRQA